RLRAEGPLRFDAFQEAALYDPEGGYYERPGRVGRSGDFVTGPSWHPAFGRTMARIARRLAEERRKEESYSNRGRGGGGIKGSPTDLVDVGAGEGELLAAADAALREWRVRDAFRLTGVERSAVRRAKAADRCPSAAWLSSLEEIPRSSLSGLLVCYELFDALPVRALFFDGERLLERVVTLAPGGKDGPGGEGAGDSFEWSLAGCADGVELLERFRSRGIRLRRNQKVEVRPGGPRLAAELASRLSRGVLLVFDYGAPARALYSAARPNGTLEAFVAHAVTRDVLADPGSRDLTAWVDFSEIADVLAACGLSVEGPVSQSRVLAAGGIFEEVSSGQETPADPAREADRRTAAALVQPGGMGESIRVLLASRGTATGAALAEWPQ
ncbi:MAG TPA: SAM-dependent methyltransferase, partial [Thermoanaerobaculia bacterium]|nr:SAM-dependent methyltransferase [Thermoanaerobaculia bacterium]